MRNVVLSLSVLALGASLLLSSGDALADGLATTPSALSPGSRASLEKDIAAWRKAHPEAFAAVAAVDTHRPEVYGKFRKPAPTTEREFRRLGPAALLPMLEALAFEAPERGSLTDAEWIALQHGMIEAVGVLRDRRAAPVLEAIFHDPNNPAPIVAAAARALGRLCGDAELSLLSNHAVAGDPLFAASVEGLGQCRRIESAKLLANLMGSTKDPVLSEKIAAALGTVSSSWAWKTYGPSAAATGMAVREIASRALVNAFAAANERTRDAIRTSLSMAEHPDAVKMIDMARASAPAATHAAFDKLRARIAARIK